MNDHERSCVGSGDAPSVGVAAVAAAGHSSFLATYSCIGYQPRGCRLNGDARCWTTSHDGSDRTVICSPFVTSAVSRLLTCTIVIARLRRFFLAIVDSRVDSTTPGSHLGVQMHAHSREATSYLGLGPGVRCRMLDRSQMMWGFHKYRLEPWGRPIASGRMY